jgi:hypothetical protein
LVRKTQRPTEGALGSASLVRKTQRPTEGALGSASIHAISEPNDEVYQGITIANRLI